LSSDTPSGSTSCGGGTQSLSGCRSIWPRKSQRQSGGGGSAAGVAAAAAMQAAAARWCSPQQVQAAASMAGTAVRLSHWVGGVAHVCCGRDMFDPGCLLQLLHIRPATAGSCVQHGLACIMHLPPEAAQHPHTGHNSLQGVQQPNAVSA
jgi:hypothetical protein